MKKKFFCANENFEKIIYEKLKAKCEVQKIETGWTNFVFIAKTKHKKYIFRFPRNNFFAEALLKEIKFCKKYGKKLGVKVPNLKLNYDKNRAYSVHKIICGNPLDCVYNDLNLKQKVKICEKVCDFLQKMSKIDAKNENFEKISCFLDKLSKVCKQEYNLSEHNFLRELESENLVVCHGDLNPGNIIIKNGKLVGIIDFAFVGISNKFCDPVRLVGRMPENFKDIFLKEYNKKFNENISYEIITNLNNVWKYVEVKYINYLKINFKDVKLPTLN